MVQFSVDHGKQSVHCAGVDRLSGLVLLALRHGGGRAGLEPVADPPTDAGRTALGEGAASIPGEPGELSLDDCGRQYPGELRGVGLVFFDAVRAGLAAFRMVWALVCGGGPGVLHLLRSAAQDAVPHLPEPPLPGVGAALSRFAYRAATARGRGGTGFADSCCAGQVEKCMPAISLAIARSCAW